MGFYSEYVCNSTAKTGIKGLAQRLVQVGAVGTVCMRLEQWIVQLDTLYLSNIVFGSAVYTEGTAYLEGKQELDAAEWVEIYLAE